jgi:hypothetical protein
MPFDVTLTTAQGRELIELLERLAKADKRTLEALELNGHGLRVLDFALYRIAIACAEKRGIVWDGHKFVAGDQVAVSERMNG